MRRRLRFRVVVALAVVAVTGCASSARGRGSLDGNPASAGDEAVNAPARDETCGAWKGAWEGTFPIRGAGTSGTELKDDLTLRVLFDTGGAEVFLRDPAGWLEAKPESFASRCLGPSAVLHSIDTALDDDGRWYESWVLVLTRRTDEEMLVRWVRMVNNVDMPLAQSSSKFSWEGVGLLRVVPLAAVPVECSEKEAKTVGELLTWACRCGAGESCELLAILSEREGDPESARRLRQRACDLGRPTSCQPAR